ncbi:CvfB family protein [Clostridium algidicarnis]|uniref:DNA-binding protein n=1 Tax=Clostridium algidicarnis TaxID=37659 RepID=A0ABS6C3Z8_9CLOT|nr:S1-like domain-containing RNA-binding protein [Clostridium algidicarnis]MBB6698226.1 DNA-binding protein [Clostridium algidicarnis]MBU3194267.1 DNA-binding protein [Clostridium algidicarnis]MBU3203821.1 DNA-binding protein [Clostridium algidicarnis]MBU3205911.1 DNA-binding protein [Clostridium algidicarnis]MBU3209772.1 DNA-binding protein [Clostridium algidicarnis]
MIKIGEFNQLKVSRNTNFGFYLDAGTGDTSEDILLPNKSALGLKLVSGDEVDAFIYRDSDDRIIATLKKPLAKVGDLAYLKVVSTTTIGSFVDFGLEKDIFVPLKEKLYPLQNGSYYLFYIYLDKTGRIAATTNVETYLSTESTYKVGDNVKATVYGFQTNNSAMVAVDNLYNGVILRNEYFTELNHGQILDLTVIKIYEDQKLGLTPRKIAKLEVDELQQTILEYLKNHDGFMIFNDKTPSEKIYKEFNVSKNHFKNALGGLMKKSLITQDINGTTLK